MSVFALWYVADDDAVDVLIDGAFEGEPTSLGGVGELELLVLGDLLGAPYEPSRLRDDEAATALRVNPPFLAALAALDDLPSIAESWRPSAESLADVEPTELEETLREMQRCAREGLGGPGVVSLPSMG